MVHKTLILVLGTLISRHFLYQPLELQSHWQLWQRGSCCKGHNWWIGCGYLTCGPKHPNSLSTQTWDLFLHERLVKLVMLELWYLFVPWDLMGLCHCSAVPFWSVIEALPSVLRWTELRWQLWHVNLIIYSLMASNLAASHELSNTFLWCDLGACNDHSRVVFPWFVVVCGLCSESWIFKHQVNLV